MKNKITELKKFLTHFLYNHPSVKKMGQTGMNTIEKLFFYFLDNIDKIPESYQKRIEEDGKHRIIVDYIAGMTDRYATQAYNDIIQIT